MRFTVIGHSCLFVETSAGSIIVDPWLFGSCYWRSWWHYPPTPAPEPEWLEPDYVSLTHHHFDHFHFPSMRRIDRDAKVLVPRFGVDVLAGEVRSLGFAEVTELPHAQVLQLSPEVRVASYQYGTDDTVFVVADGSDVLVDVNDSKIRGRALRQVRDEFGRPTFVFKSYSFAQGYPACYTADDPDDLALITRESYLDDWIRVVEEVEPEFGVPFGSMVAFLHPESRHVNQFLVPPGEVVATWEQRHPASPTTAVQMDPGDRWSSRAGVRTRRRGLVRRPPAPARRAGRGSTAEGRRPNCGGSRGHDRLPELRRVLRGVPAHVPARSPRAVRTAQAGGVRGAVVTIAVLGHRLPRVVPSTGCRHRLRTPRASCG